MSDWRVPEDKVRAVLAETGNAAEPWSLAQLHEQGYSVPGYAEAQARASADARDALLLRLPRPAENDAEAS